jgi:adenine-specific DNA glycosylase
VLLQQTDAPRVASFLPEFFAKYPTCQRLAAARLDRLEKALRPLGLQYQRARRLKSLGKVLNERRRRLPDSVAELSALPGVGPYVASAYLCTVKGMTEAPVDVNFVRLVTRLYGVATRREPRRDPVVRQSVRRLVRASGDPRRFLWAAVDFGAALCRPQRPRCAECPLAHFCAYANTPPS